MHSAKIVDAHSKLQKSSNCVLSIKLEDFRSNVSLIHSLLFEFFVADCNAGAPLVKCCLKILQTLKIIHIIS